MSCRANEPARADAPEVDLNEAFILAGGQDGLIPSEKLRLRFAEVLEDSRCPTQVECFWTGQARIALSVQPDGSGATTVEFNTNPAPGQTVKVVDAGPYSIELQLLDPYPQTPDAIRFRGLPRNISGAETLVTHEFFSGVRLFGHATDG